VRVAVADDAMLLREGVARLIARVESPTLLISAGDGVERDFNVLYDEAARGPVEHWNLPDARHTDAIRDRATEYERRVAAFFDRALLERVDQGRR
jgi:hypothetical protein